MCVKQAYKSFWVKTCFKCCSCSKHLVGDDSENQYNREWKVDYLFLSKSKQLCKNDPLGSTSGPQFNSGQGTWNYSDLKGIIHDDC